MKQNLPSPSFGEHALARTPKFDNCSSMDHIALPGDTVAQSPLEVPCLEQLRVRDDDYDMTDYSGRRAFDAELLGKAQESHFRLSEAAQFFQTCLWLAMIGEWPRVGMRRIDTPTRADYNIFIQQNSKRKLVTLARLREVLKMEEKWALSSFWNERIRRLSDCIGIANSFIQEALITPSTSESVPDSCQLLSHIFLVLLSAQVLSQTFLRPMRWLASSVLSGKSVVHNCCTEVVDSLLLRSGSCQHDVENLPRDIIFRHYLAYLQRTCLYQKVSLSNGGEDCNKHNIMEDAYLTPKHIHQQCFCPSVSVPMADVTFNDSSQYLKLYTYHTECMTLHPARGSRSAGPSLSFVAISHVRGLGLGNDGGNFLPHCQLSLLQRLANQIIEPDCESGNTPFWVDALGLPIDHESRKLGIRFLPTIFTRASAVLVLDPTLYMHSFNHADEAIIRIRYSSWKSRLWTLEEGFYAQKLVFRFSDCLISLEDILRKLRPSLIIRANLINNSHGTFDFPRSVDLQEVLLRFSSDIHSAGELGLPVNKSFLYNILRAGYLLSQRFSLLLEQSEVELQRKMMPAIFAIYGSEVCFFNTAASLAKRLDQISYYMKKKLEQDAP